MDRIYTISEIAEIIEPIVMRSGVKTVWLFGSYARGEVTEKSDVDLLIDYGCIRTLFELTAFCLDCEDTPGKFVDIVTFDAMKPRLALNIQKDDVMIYDAA